MANEKNLVRPSVSGLDGERRLKKVATKGVVTLFNAIMNFQRAQRRNQSSDQRRVCGHITHRDLSGDGHRPS